MKPTKRQIQIVEHFVKKTTKSMLTESKYVAGTQLYFKDRGTYGIVIKSRYDGMVAWNETDETGEVISKSANMLSSNFFQDLVTSGKIRIVK